MPLRRLTLLTLLMLAASARATTLAPLDMKALVQRADRVLLAKVESQVARWTEAHDAIYTEVTLRVVRAYKGAARPGETVVVRREGGSVDGIGMRVYGAASFEPGEEALVFVEKRGAASFVVGMTQGKMRVEIIDGQRMVRGADLGHVRLAPNAVEAPSPPGERRALVEVEREIQALVRTSK
jgi:hypothetical protein